MKFDFKVSRILAGSTFTFACFDYRPAKVMACPNGITPYQKKRSSSGPHKPGAGRED